jgi:integrase
VLEILQQCGKSKRALEAARHTKALKNPHSKPHELVKKDVWSAGTYNYYRSHLQMLFKVLVVWQALENNPVDNYLPIKKEVKNKMRPTLSEQQRIDIDAMLRESSYTFWRFMHIFFTSGARETEIMKVKKEDVDTRNQTVTYTILKGSHYTEERRPIPDDTLPLWKEVLAFAKPGQFLFAKGLVPGDKSIRPEQISRRWRVWVKNRTDSNGKKLFGDSVADFYSLKHSHSTEVANKVGTRLAAMHNKHTEAILKKNYDVDGENRDMQILKGVKVSFVPEKLKLTS